MVTTDGQIKMVEPTIEKNEAGEISVTGYTWRGETYEGKWVQSTQTCTTASGELDVYTDPASETPNAYIKGFDINARDVAGDAFLFKQDESGGLLDFWLWNVLSLYSPRYLPTYRRRRGRRGRYAHHRYPLSLRTPVRKRGRRGRGRGRGRGWGRRRQSRTRSTKGVDQDACHSFDGERFKEYHAKEYTVVELEHCTFFKHKTNGTKYWVCI